MADCLFCKIASGEIPSRKVYADERFYAFEDINPQAPTHFLIVPRRHIPTLDDLYRTTGPSWATLCSSPPSSPARRAWARAATG